MYLLKGISGFLETIISFSVLIIFVGAVLFFDSNRRHRIDAHNFLSGQKTQGPYSTQPYIWPAVFFYSHAQCNLDEYNPIPVPQQPSVPFFRMCFGEFAHRDLSNDHRFQPNKKQFVNRRMYSN